MGLALRYDGFWGRPVLVENGQPAEKGEARSELRLVKSDGSEATALMRFQTLGIQPYLIIEGKVYRLPSPLKWYHWLWSAIPLLLIAGGMTGGILGALAFYFSLRILRSDRPAVQRFLSALGLSILALFLWAVIDLYLLPVSGR